MRVRSRAMNNTVSSGVSGSPYQIGGQTGAEFAGLIIWLVLWLINGYFTVLFFQVLGAPNWGGMLAHVAISLLEQHGYRSRRFSVYMLIFLVGLFDVFSSAWGVQAFLMARGAPSGDGNYLVALVYTMLAMAIAIPPERALYGHVQALRALVQR